MKYILNIILIIILSQNLYAEEYLEFQAANGDGIQKIFSKYKLSYTAENINLFKKINANKLKSNDNLTVDTQYKLPILLFVYNNINIRSSIGIEDYNIAKKIQTYNESIHISRVKKKDYKQDKIIWVPCDLIQNQNKHNINTTESIKSENKYYKIFGKNYSDVDIVDNSLKGHFFYLVSGHGGPDPGAIGKNSGNELHEDEYAYDVTLRLARKLLSHNASVYIIVQDPNDGIRDERYLKTGNDEVYFGNIAIAPIQKERLQKSADIINSLYKKNRKKAKSQQAVITHVDSRYTDKRIDIFFYYAENSDKGQKLANTLLNAIQSKYEQKQPTRGYEGTVTYRKLFMLEKTIPTTVYIEIGNIQNPQDQVRILEKDNRQAMANWLSDGLIKYINQNY